MFPIRAVYLFLCVYVYYLSSNSESLYKRQIKFATSLLSPQTSISTITPIYKKHHKNEHPEPKESSIENDFYLNYTEKFSIDDTEKILNSSYLECVPSNFGYSVENGNLVFPPESYPKCTEINKHPVPELVFDYSQNTFTMHCQSGSPHYILEPTKQKGRLFEYDEFKDIIEVQKYSKPVKLTTEEFVLAGCDSKVFNNALHFPRVKPEVYLKTSEKMQKLGQKQKPLIVMMLTIDSYSRRHFYRKMPKTHSFLNNLGQDYVAFDFRLHNVFGGNSVENMVPVFTDQKYQNIEKPREYDVFKADSMWGHFRDKGFVTLFELEDCDHYFPNALGRRIEVDHSVRSFYCASKYAANFDAELNNAKVQRCIGEHMSHYYTLNFTYEFSRIYSGLNQWIYMHLNPAHEATGQHAVTLDEDLLEFLQKYLKKFGKDHDLAIFLQADHGMRYGNWYQDLEAYQENKLPVFFLINSRNLIDRIPFAYNNLIENEYRLTTKKDLRPTINFLADLPYFVPEPKEQGVYINFYTEKAHFNRTCEELNISPFDCSCLVVEELKNITKDHEFYELILKVLEETLFKINSVVHSPVTGAYEICKKVSLHKILNTYGSMVNNKVEELQIKFSVNENPNAIFEVFAFVGSHPRSSALLSSGSTGTVINYQYRGFKTRIKIFGIVRKDKYAGKCEDVTRELGIKSEYCLCDSQILSTYT